MESSTSFLIASGHLTSGGKPHVACPLHLLSYLNLGLLCDDAAVVSVELGVTIRANMVIPVTIAGPVIPISSLYLLRLVRCL
jgi:hypothetical protein